MGWGPLFPLAGSGGGGSVAEDGPGGAGAVGGRGSPEESGRAVALAAAAAAAGRRSAAGLAAGRPYAGGVCRRMKLIAASSDRGSVSSLGDAEGKRSRRSWIASSIASLRSGSGRCPASPG